MPEPTGTALPTTKGTSLWIIVIVVIVVLCCFCIGAIGLLFAFGGPILNELGILQSCLLSLAI
jgi:flagellar basal body-associated protein FliL